MHASPPNEPETLKLLLAEERAENERLIGMLVVPACTRAPLAPHLTAAACAPRPIRQSSPVQRGWHTRSATSVNTRRLLVEHGGFLYDSNAYNDDCPFVVTVGDHSHVVLPYAFDSNDMRFQNNGGFVFADDFTRYCIDAFDRLYSEGKHAPRMMSVGLHPRIIGRPGRIAGLERFLDHVASRSGVWFARRDAIAEAWRRGIGLPAWQPRPTHEGFAP